MEFEAAQELCVCPTCPSYVSCGEATAYCLWPEGTSGCISEEKGCICARCPVHRRQELRFDYYCTRGAEQTQAGS